MAIKDFEHSSFEIAQDNQSLKYQLELKDDKIINKLQAEKRKMKQNGKNLKNCWHNIMSHLHKRIYYDKDESYKIVNNDLYKNNGVFIDNENEIANNIYRKVTIINEKNGKK